MLDGVAYCQMLFDEAGQPADWLYLEVNPAFEALTGLRDAAGKRVSQLVPGVRETNPELFEIYGRVAQTGVSEQFETYLPAFERWFSVKVYRPQEGHFAAVFENVTERKRLDEALRERVRRLYDTNIIGTLIARTDGEILEANDYFLGLIGHTCEELERGELSWRALTPREWLPVSDHAIGQMRIHGTSAPYEKEYLRADGTRVPVLVVATSLAGPDELSQRSCSTIRSASEMPASAIAWPPPSSSRPTASSSVTPTCGSPTPMPPSLRASAEVRRML